MAMIETERTTNQEQAERCTLVSYGQIDFFFTTLGIFDARIAST
jgi:hypothetical protein